MRSGAFEALIPKSFSPLRPRSSPMSHHKRQASKIDDQENAPPPNPNVQIQPPPGLFSGKQKQQQAAKSVPVQPAEPAAAAAARTQPAGVHTPTPSPPLASPNSTPARVAVRIRPLSSTEEGKYQAIRKISPTSLSIDGQQQFNFDAVFGPSSTQEDVFQLVGAPLVKDALQGFNTSIMCYGETGSGKTYTMWGPLSSMLDEQTSSNSQGIAPRIFQMLFSEIQTIQQCTDSKQVNFQCRCSLLEIYDAKINDLLDPTQRNLEIKDDGRGGGVYVENLSEEYVSSTEDVIQILVKGLSNRRVGATSINSKSSRSHVILTCTLESWCKETSFDESFSNSRTSKITLVDLAGLEINAPDAASGRYKKEGRHIKRSLSSLGKAINSLGGHKSPCGNRLPCGDSCLTNLLRESLGGNAKVAFICTVSPTDRCKAGSLSTLRFGQRTKCLENNAVVNEITEDYVNDLSDQIRQLKEELIKEKTVGTDPSSKASGFFKRHNARGSLNRLRASLNRSLVLPQIEDDTDVLVSTSQEDVKELYLQINNLHSSCLEESAVGNMHGNSSSIHVENLDDSSIKDSISVRDSFKSVCSCDDDFDNLEDLDLDCDPTNRETDRGDMIKEGPLSQDISRTTGRDPESPRNFDVPVSLGQHLSEPVLSTSPDRNCSTRKRLSKASCSLTSEALALNSVSMSFRGSESIRSSLQLSKFSPTAALAESLHRGLQIIDRHQQRPASKNSIEFSFDYLKNAGQSERTSDAAMQISSVNDKDNDYSQASQRIVELEDICSKQEAAIKELNQQVERYKQEAEIKSIVEVLELKEEKVSEDQEKSNLQGGDDFANYGRNELIEEIQLLRNKLKLVNIPVSLEEPEKHASEEANLLALCEPPRSPSIALEYEREKQRWMEAESKWISLTEELRYDIESSKRVVEKKNIELDAEKKSSEELEDALQRAILGHGRMVEHYAELQDKYVTLLEQHRQVMDGITEVKKAAAKAGKKSHGAAFAHALNSELAKSRAQKEKERVLLKEQNKVLKMQLKDTAEAVQAAGELLVKLREAEDIAVLSEEKYAAAQEEVERLKKQIEKMKKKHDLEMGTMKQYIAESRLPESALAPYYVQEHQAERPGSERSSVVQYDTQSWRAAFEPSYR